MIEFDSIFENPEKNQDVTQNIDETKDSRNN